MTKPSFFGVLAPALLSLSVVLAAPARANPCTLSALEWMAGTWRAGEGHNASEERWVGVSGGRLMGSSWSLS